jgi:hypothetical protein
MEISNIMNTPFSSSALTERSLPLSEDYTLGFSMDPDSTNRWAAPNHSQVHPPYNDGHNQYAQTDIVSGVFGPAQNHGTPLGNLPSGASTPYHASMALQVPNLSTFTSTNQQGVPLDYTSAIVPDGLEATQSLLPATTSASPNIGQDEIVCFGVVS